MTGRKSVSETKEWGTPKKYVDAVKKVFKGSIDLDPCSNRYSLVNARTEYIFPYNDGLMDSWEYGTIFVNPPYGIDKTSNTTISDWLRRCSEANENGSNVLALIPVATNTKHWKQWVFPKARAICFLYDTRLRFLEKGRDNGRGAPMSCAMVYWGNDFDGFRAEFRHHGAILEVSR